MKVKKIILSDIKSFDKPTEFDLSSSDRINTVSGVNGSGKTTVFKSLILAQKLFFSVVNDIKLNNSEELLNYFNSKNSYISIFFIFDDSSEAVFSIKSTNRTKELVEFNLVITDNDKNKISEFWNLQNPKNLIIYIDSNRTTSESNFSNEDINISNINSKSLLSDYIIQPDKLFNTTYERLMKDYIRERIIPSTPRTDLPHYTSKILLHNLLEYLEFSNFTALERKDQFILQVKRGKEKQKHIYDLRNLSSGEKTLFYVIHFICYVRSIGMLIIDEPENNLHEDMLMRFVNMLYDITYEESFSELIFNNSEKIKHKVSDNLIKQITSFYKEHKLSQTYLLTHSKNLIYNNFNIGKNFIVNDGISLIDYENHEKKLRELGLSKIISKVLFVEGKTENEILQSIFAPENIKVQPLKNSHDVVETYKKYYSFHTHIRDVQFCFLIDKDTREDIDINKIRDLDFKFFDKHFIILDKHEVENYLLDAKVIQELFKKHNEINDDIKVLSIQEITNSIREIADDNKEHVLKKTIQNLNQNSLSELKLAVSKKDINVNSEIDYTSYIESIFASDSIEKTKENVIKNFERIKEIENRWARDWLDLCDGKIVFNKSKSIFSNYLQIKPDRFEKELIKLIQQKKSHEFNKIINSINQILK